VKLYISGRKWEVISLEDVQCVVQDGLRYKTAQFSKPMGYTERMGTRRANCTILGVKEG